MAGEDAPGLVDIWHSWAVPRIREAARTFFRLSPAERAARSGCFAVRRGQALYRADVNYNLLGEEVERRFSKTKFGLTPIGSFEVMLQYGCSQRASEEPIGVPILRMNNLQSDGWDFSELKYVDLEDAELTKWQLRRGDIVFNRTNSKELVGKCEVFDRDGTWVFASYLMRLRVDRTQAEPEFVTAFLNTRAGRLQIDRESRQIIGMSNINAEEIRTLRVPLPQPRVQRDLLAQLDLARSARKQKLHEAHTLLASLDSFVLNILGITLMPSGSPRTTYAVRLGAARAAKKLYPDYFHPERLSAIQAVEEKYTGDRCATLGTVATFVRDQRQVTPSDAYLGLANIQSNTGERVESTDEDGGGTVFEYTVNDVLFARLRPYLNKVYRAEESGVCSTEFHVMRPRQHLDGQPSVLPDYLAAVLRSSLVLSQTRHMMTGNTHPRLTNDDVVNLVVPVPEERIQRGIVSEVAKRRATARQLRQEADDLWDEAKRQFEEALLGPGPRSDK